jgi:PAS domain S-box-containing protein
VPSGPVRILLIEDNPVDAELLQLTLHRASPGDFEFTCVGRLAEAVARLGQESFDVLLLDLSLPDSFGLETFRRAHHAAPHTPIVVLSGGDDEDISLAVAQTGAQDYVVKGETGGRQTARVIRYAIQRKQAEEQLRQEREWLRSTLNSIGHAVVTCDTGGRIMFLNSIACSLTGWKSDEALGLPLEDILRIGDPVTRALKENRAISLTGQAALLTRNGREVVIEGSAAPILDAAGHAAGVVLVLCALSKA